MTSEPIETAPTARRDGLALVAGAFLFIALICGGSSSSPLSAAIVRIAATPVLALGLVRLTRDDRSRGALWPLILVGAAAAWVLIQLIPLPPSLWTALPGRDLYAHTYRAAGLPLPWLPIDLAPAAGWSAFLGFLPPAAMLAAAPGLASADRRRLSYVVLVAALVSAALGMAQMAGGEGSPLRFYAITNKTSAVGLFANRNHEASFLAATLPLAGYLAVRGIGRTGGRAAFWLGAAAAYAFIVALGAAASGSRAGAGLALLGAMGAIVVALRAMARRPGAIWRAAALAWPALVAALVAGLAALALDPALARGLETRIGGDLRFSLTPITARAGAAFAPVGAGAGAFAEVYPMVEPVADMGPAYINHAHDDLAEVWLEAGLPGLVLIGALFLWWTGASVQAMVDRRRPAAGLALAGSMTVGMLLVHSLVDYPLRTPALATLFAFALGLVTLPPDAHRRGAA